MTPEQFFTIADKNQDKKIAIYELRNCIYNLEFNLADTIELINIFF